MELYQLRYFSVIAKQKSYTKAAEILNVTQPTLSIAVKKLEAEMGVTLFTKDGKTTVLSEAGKILEPIFTAILADVDLAYRTTEEYNKSVVSRTRLGLPQMSCDDLILSVKEHFSEKDGVFVSISQLRFEDVRARLVEGSLDVGIILKPDGSENDKNAAQALEYADYKTIACNAYVSSSHRFAKYGFVTPEMLKEEKLLISGMEEGISRVIINYMREELGGFTPERGDYIDPYLTLRIAESYGVAFFPENIDYDQEKLVCVPLSPAPQLKLAVAWNKSKRQTELQKKLIEFIKNH